MIDYAALLASGELATIAASSVDQADFARRLGTTSGGYRGHVRRTRASGKPWPTYDELRGVADCYNSDVVQQKRRADAQQHLRVDDFADEEPTQQNRSLPSFGDEDRSRRVSGHETDHGSPIPNAGTSIPDSGTSPLLNDEHVPGGHYIKGVSTYFDGDGVPRAQWVKTSTTHQQQLDGLIAALPTLLEPYRGKSELIPQPSNVNDDLLAVYPIGDAHIGLLAWAAESGDDFDISIAERDIVDAVDHLAERAPPAKQGLIIWLGDNMHADNSSGTTTKGTRVDVDTRWAKMFMAAIRTGRRTIERGLERHDHMTAIIEIGNHDALSAVAFAHALAQFYENNPRVTIDTSPAKFHYYRFGDNLIVTTHGDTCKPDKLPGVVACNRPKDWGETTYRYGYTGHEHHDRTKEFPGLIVDTMRTLAASDAWHQAQGYHSGRDMKVDTIHRQFGRINRATVNVHELRAKRAG
jgi:hypothetical protein